MTALPADIAKYTADGIVVTTNAVTGAAIKAAHVDAQDLGDQEIEMFFVNDAHAQAMLDERFALLSIVDPVHEGIEVEEALGLGTTIAIAPTVPSFRVVDDSRNIDQVVRLRAYAHDMSTDRFSVEVLQ